MEGCCTNRQNSCPSKQNKGSFVHCENKNLKTTRRANYDPVERGGIKRGNSHVPKRRPSLKTDKLDGARAGGQTKSGNKKTRKRSAKSPGVGRPGLPRRRTTPPTRNRKGLGKSVRGFQKGKAPSGVSGGDGGHSPRVKRQTTRLTRGSEMPKTSP